MASSGEIVAMLKSPPRDLSTYAGQCLARPSMYVPGGLLYYLILCLWANLICSKMPALPI